MKKKIVVGAGNGGKFVLNWIGKDKVAFFADGDINKVGKEICGKEIISYERLSSLESQYDIYICPSKYEKEIEQSLKSAGVSKYYWAREELLKSLFQDQTNNGKRIILLNSHDGINLGDYLIAVAERYFFKTYMSEYEVIEIPQNLCAHNMSEIRKYLKSNDVIVISGGGYLGSLWLSYGEDTVREAIQELSDYKIVIFPQTLYFENNAFGEDQQRKSMEIYNSHDNLTVCLRDARSYELGRKIFRQEVKCAYIPDMVTMLDYSDEFINRSGVLLCFREDKEAVIDSSFSRDLDTYLRNSGIEVDEMSMLLEEEIQYKDRDKYIEGVIKYVKSHRLVVTDRLHCMLLALISGTPCVAFDNLSQKVSGVHKWIENNSYIQCVNSVKEFENIWVDLYNSGSLNYDNKQVLKFFNALCEIVKG